MNILIKNGYIVDGAGSPWFKADIEISAGKIRKIGKVTRKTDTCVIEAKNLIVSPGFIDIHSHADLNILRFSKAESLIMQGVTTAVVGNCGLSLAPVTDININMIKEEANLDSNPSWANFAELFKKIETDGTAINLASLVGHGTIRSAVMGLEDREPTSKELENMSKLLSESMKDGAFGMSTGLTYPPGVYSKTSELIYLAKTARKNGGIYASHIRGESDALLAAVKEAIEIAEKAGVPLQISHLKASGEKNWGKVSEVLHLMENARKKGIEVTCDVYPYTAGSMDLPSLLPPWVLVGGSKAMVKRLRNPVIREHIREDIEKEDPKWENFVKDIGWQNIFISYSAKNKKFEGKDIASLAKEGGKDPYEALFDLLIGESGNTQMITFEMSEDDVLAVLSNHLSMVCSDSEIWNPKGGGKPHPRGYGAFARVFGKYVKQGFLSLEDAVRKMTSLPAQKIGLWDRGLIREGMCADIAIFDPNVFADKATYSDPHQYAAGLKYVLVNGEVAVENGKQTDMLSGRVLRRKEGSI